jgi:hypothetical protein
MPFTFAHPAAILPLRRFKFLYTVPLVIGSIAPDLPYYIPARFNRLMQDTHTALGTLYLDIPIGFAVLLVGFWLRGPLTALMTTRARALCLRSLERFKNEPRHWLLSVLAIYVGAWTHLAWDSFTHDTGWVVKRVSALSAPITIGGYTGTMCHILQYVSSVAGLVILAIWYFRLTAPAAESSNPPVVSPFGRALLLLLVSLAATAIGVFISVRAALIGHSNYHVIYLLLTRSIAWFGMLYLLAGLFVTLSRRKPEPVPET